MFDIRRYFNILNVNFCAFVSDYLMSPFLDFTSKTFSLKT